MGECRFPVLAMLLGVNASVKCWVSAQCGGCEGSASHSPITGFLPEQLDHAHLACGGVACKHRRCAHVLFNRTGNVF